MIIQGMTAFCTENSELEREVKVVEEMRGTVTVKNLKRSYLFKTRPCGRNHCVISIAGCGYVYQIKCKECLQKYRGKTRRSI